MTFERIVNKYNMIKSVSSGYQKSFLMVQNTHHAIAQYILNKNEVLYTILSSVDLGDIPEDYRLLSKPQIFECLDMCLQVLVLALKKYLVQEKSEKYLEKLTKIIPFVVDVADRTFSENDIVRALREAKAELDTVGKNKQYQHGMLESVWMVSVRRAYLKKEECRLSISENESETKSLMQEKIKPFSAA